MVGWVLLLPSTNRLYQPSNELNFVINVYFSKNIKMLDLGVLT